MPPVAIDISVTQALAADAPVAIGVSGGKDSQAALIATLAHLDAIGHAGPRLLVHADLGMVEWKDSLAVCERMSRDTGVELVVVARRAGGLMERWEARWASSIARYAALETVTLVPCWSTPSMRFCTSELKTHVIAADLNRRFPGRVIVNVTGVRREESANRARQPISDMKDRTINWRPILDWTTADVFAAIDASGMPPHPAYRQFGMSRVSCRFCIMSSLPDLKAAAGQVESHALYRRMVALEAASSFAFQGARWLGDVAPHLLDAGLAQALSDGKSRAAARKAIEASIPADLLYAKGWPVRLPTAGEAGLLAEARRRICDLFGIDGRFLDAEQVLERYAELMALKAEKAAIKAGKAAKKAGARSLAA